jgi:beta-glucosidase
VSVFGLVAVLGPVPNSAASARAARASGSPTPQGTGPHLSSGARPRARAAASACPWLNQSLSIPERVDMLMARMNLTEKVGEMYIDEGATSGPYAGYEGYVPAQPALCIPDLVEEDGPAGVAYGATGVTQLPAEVSLGAAWDPSLAAQYGVVDGQQHRDKGVAMTLAPGVNIQRDPRWGRNFEMFSEDPFLTSALGTADIEGIQSQHELADVKHFATYNQETYRNTSDYDTVLSTRVLHEIYLPPFYSAVKQANAASIMCSYPLLNGQYSCQDAGLLTGILDDRWGFPGFVRADSSANNSTVDSANAGLDQERGSFYWDNGLLIEAVEDGQVKLSTVNAAVRRILTEMFKFDLFNAPPTGNLSTPANTGADDGFALNVAERGTVLLQNTGHVLPLSTATTKSIAVIGADGTTTPLTSGGGSSKVRPPYVISPLTGITDRAGSAAAVTSYSGIDPTQAAAAARSAQVAVVFASYSEAEGGDLANISLPNGQDEIIEAIAAANPNTIVVLNTGGPVLMPWLHQVKAVLEAWYPGQEDGAAIASLLFGDTDPSGHLTETFPSSLAEMPTSSRSRFPGVDGEVHYSEGLDVGYRWYDAHHVTPLFPFGYGLSYTSFRFSHLTVTPKPLVNRASGPETSAGQGATLAHVSARISNTGSVGGSDVVQLYVGDPAAAGEPPRQLEGFRRVTLAPGTSRTVSFPVTGHELSYFNTNANGWTLPAGRFSIYVGDSSALTSLPLQGKLTVAKTIGTRYATLAAPRTVDSGTTFTVTARFVNRGSLPIKNGIVQLKFPSGWMVVRAAPKRTLSVPVGQTVLRNYSVTAPEKAEGSVTKLTAELSSKGIDRAGDLSATAAVAVARPISLTPSKVAVAVPGLSAAASVVVTSQMNRRVRVELKPSPPPGVAVAPVSPSVSVPAHGTVSLRLSVAAAAGEPPATDFVALHPSFVDHGRRYSLGTSVLTVDVPYASLAAAFNTNAISDDTDVAAASFDGNGNSYSEQALTSVGLSPGASVTVGATTLQWPDVPAGTPDSVLADGQTVSLAGSPADTQLIVLGASSGAKESGNGAVEYSDGTIQPYRLTLDNWFNLPSGSNAAIATTAYVNDSTGDGNQGVVGQRHHNAYVFAVSIPLQSGKTVSSVTLPRVGLLPGVYPMHVFALGLGSTTYAPSSSGSAPAKRR